MQRQATIHCGTSRKKTRDIVTLQHAHMAWVHPKQYISHAIHDPCTYRCLNIIQVAAAQSLLSCPLPRFWQTRGAVGGGGGGGGGVSGKQGLFYLGAGACWPLTPACEVESLRSMTCSAPETAAGSPQASRHGSQVCRAWHMTARCGRLCGSGPAQPRVPSPVSHMQHSDDCPAASSNCYGAADLQRTDCTISPMYPSPVSLVELPCQKPA